MNIFAACVTVRNRSLLVTPLLLLALAASVHADPLFLAPFLSFDTGIGPQSVAIGDLNGDGRPDLVTANNGVSGDSDEYVGATASVLLGNGDGTFAPRTDFGPVGTSASPSSVAIADLNGDGRLDLAVALWGWGWGLVLLGNGDGTFATSSDLGFDTGLRPQSVAIGDLNADGRPDVATANSYSSTASVALGNGDGTFGLKTDFATGSGPFSVAIGDLNADGRPDLATANLLSNTVSVLLGNGDGTFGAKTDFGTRNSPRSVAIGDLNGDGRPDLAVATDAVSVLLGNGDGTFGPRIDFGAEISPYLSVAIADLNADGRPDLAAANSYAANSYSGAVSVFLGNGDGTFAPKTDFASEYPVSMAIADLNADGRPDLATANTPASPHDVPKGNTVSVLLGNGDGTFGVKTEFDTGSHPVSVAIADLNADGRPDLATANSYSNTASVLLGNGEGTFGAKTDFGTGPYPTAVAVGDLNADGRPDLATANSYSNTASVLLGNGDGTFGLKTDFGTGIGANSVTIADLNGDGRPDLATANIGANTVSVLLGNGDGTFGSKTDFDTGPYPTAVAVGDLNADGRPDLATANAYPSTSSVLLGNGDGTFGPKTDFGSWGYSVAIADLNADGRPDLAVASSAVTVSLGNGDGTFAPGTGFGAGSYASSVAIADLNADGRPDLALAGANTVSVFLGNGDGTFAPRTAFGTGSGGPSVAIADLNADGRPDLAVATGYTTVLVLLHSGPSGCPQTSMSFDISPNTLNLRSRAHWVTATLEPGPPATPADIDISSIRLNHSVQVDPSAPTSIGDVDGDGRPDLTVKFSRMAVELTVPEGDAVPVTVSGTIGSGCFDETELIRVIRVPVTAPSAGSLLQSGSAAEVRWDTPAGIQVQSVSILSSFDDGSTWNLVAQGLPNTGSYLWTVSGAATDQARIAVVLVESADSGGDEVVGVLGVSGRFAIASPLAVDGASIGLSLHGSVPNPGRILSMSFTLPDASSARLVAYDISGREVSRREVSHLGMGRHVVTLSPRKELAPGVYLVHLIQGNRRLVARAVVIR